MSQNPALIASDADPPLPTVRSTLPHPPTSRLMTTEEVARLLRVDPSSVRRWRAERPPQGPPFIRLSDRVVLYDDNDLQTWLDERRTDPGQVAA